MALLETLPDEVENTLRDLHYSDSPVGKELDTLETPSPDAEAPIRVAFATDINSSGDFGPEWLVTDESHLYVFSPNGGNRAKVRHAIPLSDVKKAFNENGVGSGQIEVLTIHETIPLLRYSQAVVAEANVVTRQLNALAKGEKIKAENAEEFKQRHCSKCNRILPKDTDVCPACINKRAILVRLFSFLQPYKGLVALGLVFLVLSTATGLAPPYIVGRLIDQLVLQGKVHNMAILPVVHWILLLAGLGVINTLISYCQQRLNPWLGGKVSMDIRMQIFDKLNRFSLGYYDKRSTGSVMSRITNDADNLWDFITGGLPWITTNVLTLTGIGLVLFKLNYHLALLMLIPAPFIFMLTRWFMPRSKTRFRVVWHRISKMYSAINSTVSGIRVVKAFAQEEREVGRFENRADAVFTASYEANAFRASFGPLLGLLMSSGSYLIWIAGGGMVLHNRLSLGELTMFNGYLWQFYQPFQNFSQWMDWSTRSMTAAERVFEILDTEPDIQETPDAKPLPEMCGAVEFENVSFTYDKARRALEDFTLSVKPGEMIGLVGHSGAGKTTIINLLSRFYDVSEGSIKVDGIDIRDIREADYHRQFGIVPQEPFLFPGTLRDNIAYSRPNATEVEVMRAAKAANCHEFIIKFPDGYDTQVGERGQRLSGGERQRISIARAILHDPKILILDEATASVDTETEKLIQEAISRLIENRTTFAIAHRLSTLRNASRLVVMKEGKMVETGTHTELIELDGVYANLVKVQTEINRMRVL